MAEIQGAEFSLWWDVDQTQLKVLSFTGRVEWLRKRIERVLLKPLAALEAREQEMFVWLAVTELVCAGIEALGGFYGYIYQGGKKSKQTSSFRRFIGSFWITGFPRQPRASKARTGPTANTLRNTFVRAWTTDFQLNGADFGMMVKMACRDT